MNHRGFYEFSNIEEKLVSIQNPCYDVDSEDDFIGNAQYFLCGICHIFAFALHEEFNYPVYKIVNGKECHVFCKKGDQYIDVRGATSSFEEFKRGLWGNFNVEQITEYCDDDEIDANAYEFAKVIIDTYRSYYN